MNGTTQDRPGNNTCTLKSGGKRLLRRILLQMKKHESARVVLSSEAQSALFSDVCKRHYIEACGILIGTVDEQGNWQVDQVYPLRNIFDSPVYFEFAPEDLLQMELTYPDQIVGVYHSHPTGFAVASTTDRENMKRVNLDQQIPWLWIIISGPFNDAFVQRAHGVIPPTAIIAYHHYPQGLRQITVELEEVPQRS